MVARLHKDLAPEHLELAVKCGLHDVAKLLLVSELLEAWLVEQ